MNVYSRYFLLTYGTSLLSGPILHESTNYVVSRKTTLMKGSKQHVRINFKQ